MFFETIKLLNGQLHNLHYHQERINRTIGFHYTDKKEVNINDILHATSIYPKGLYKVRVDYDLKINKVSIDPYQIKLHRKLKIIDTEGFNYSFKYADRSFFTSQLLKHPDCDDILFTENGYLTDTTYCNIAIFDGKEWITPKTYLLPGTKRTQLIAEKRVFERTIHVNDLPNYEQIVFINAMRDFEKKYTFTLHQNEITLQEI